MAKTTNPQSFEVGDKRPARGPTKRALGLDPEITAQPRPITDDLGRETASEPGLSCDADELGSRFLREATEQGDFDPAHLSELELSLLEDPTGDDDDIVVAHFAYERSVWDQTVDLQLQTRGDSAQLREPAPPPDDDFDQALDPSRADDDHGEVNLTRSYIREISLLDREGGEGDEVEVPEVDSEDGGRHARNTPRASAASSGAYATPRAAKLGRASRAAVRKTAGWVQRMAEWLNPKMRDQG